MEENNKMYCSHCGRAIRGDALFCPFCGTKTVFNEQKEKQVALEQEQSVELLEQENHNYQQTTRRGPWAGFAKAGMILGIVSISTFFICFPSLICGIPGIVLSALGKKSAENRGKASSGLVLSIVGFVLGYIMYIIYLMA